ncbi:MAG: T9SS type A sorting domain-containing protein [Bacteroidales bacterium]|nr:T9SS type A sorting domain-containing protein [Bacteroidales bacterium]
MPNPAAQEINIPIGNQLQQASHFIVISDLNGKEYLKVPVQQGQSLSNISTSSLPSGSYIYRVEGNGISMPAGKFVKR